MRDFSLFNLEDQFNHQVIHMDQAVCYNPEYRVSGMMHDYPSRKLQLIRAIWKGELKPSDYTADLIFNYIFSRQGERWQNFGEDPEDCTRIFMLCRELMLEKGYGMDIAAALRERFKTYNDHFLPVEDVTPLWQAAVPMDPESDTMILLDEASAYYGADSAGALAAFLQKKGLSSKTVLEPVCLGFEFFAHGIIDEGTTHLQSLAACINESGAAKVLVLSAQAAWILRSFAPFLGIDIVPEVLYLPELTENIVTPEPAYVYGGSFNLRYLCNGMLLNNIVANSEEKPIPTSAEFIPLLKGDHRVNRLTIWQKPLGPEYVPFGMDDAVLNGIKEDALNDIRKADAKMILAFEPTALPVLKAAFPELPVVNYIDLL